MPFSIDEDIWLGRGQLITRLLVSWEWNAYTLQVSMQHMTSMKVIDPFSHIQ